MKESIVIVIAAIVILVIALVLLTIFGKGITPAGDFASRESMCKQSAAATCKISNELPSGWSTSKYRVIIDGNEEFLSCYDLTGITSCNDI